MDDPQSAEIKNEMAATVSHLADKLEALEAQFVEPATAAVTETVTQVKDAVTDTAEAVQSTVNQLTRAFDFSTHVRKYPWRMIGAGMAAGFLLEHLLRPRQSEIRAQVTGSLVSPSEQPSAMPTDQDQRSRFYEVQAAENGRLRGSFTNSQAPQHSQPLASGWGQLAAGLQGALSHSLIPVWQGLAAAVFERLLRPTTDGQTDGPNGRTTRREEASDEVETEEQPEWGGRLRARPK